MDKKLPVYTAIAASGVAVIMLAAISTIEIETAEVIATSENAASNATAGPFTGVQVDEAVVLHLDNAETAVMQGNNTAAILELIEAVRLEHGTFEIGTEGSVP